MMKKSLLLIPVVITSSNLVLSANPVVDMFEKGKVSGEWRTFYIDRDRHGSTGNNQQDTNGLSTGGYLKYETGKLGSVSTGMAFYTTNPLDSNPSHRDPTLSNDNKEGYTILGEAYLQYDSPTGNMIKIGRQKLDTPLAGSDDVRMLPNLFEALVLKTDHIEKSTLILAHVSRFSAGSFSNAYPQAGGALALSTGYGLNNDSGTFMNMGEYAVGEKTKGVSALGFMSSLIPNTKLTVWDYFAHDILNAIYAKVEISQTIGNVVPMFSAQYISEKNTGDKLGGKIDSNYYDVQVGGKIGSWNASTSFSQTGSNSSGSGKNGAILSPWGGIPSFTQGMVTRHQFFEDTRAFKFSTGYNFQKETGHNVSLNAYYATYSMGDKNDYVTGNSWTTIESGFDLIYAPTDKLSFRLRGNYPADFKEDASGNTLDWSETRFITSYKF